MNVIDAEGYSHDNWSVLFRYFNFEVEHELIIEQSLWSFIIQSVCGPVYRIFFLILSTICNSIGSNCEHYLIFVSVLPWFP